jgi:hypothetical protein
VHPLFSFCSTWSFMLDFVAIILVSIALTPTPKNASLVLHLHLLLF